MSAEEALGSVTSFGRPFIHEALLYTGDDGFLRTVVPFVEEGLAGGEAVMVAVDGARIARLRAELGPRATDVRFEDMATLGRNPTHIIPAWHEFVSRQAALGRPVRGVGEPVWPGRSPDELVECRRHEALLNLAFADARDFWLLCPYDVSTLEGDAIAGAAVTHPCIVESGLRRSSPSYLAPAPVDLLDQPLPEPPLEALQLSFDVTSLHLVRDYVADVAGAAGLPCDRAADLAVAVNEVATNSVRHGGGGGILTLWRDGDRLVADVRDRGRIADPLVDRRRPAVDSLGGRGLWMANHLCDLVQVRSSPAGTIVRLHVHAGWSGAAAAGPWPHA